MKSLSPPEARRTLPALTDEVSEQGEEIIITRRGQPVMRLVPILAEVPKMALRGLPIQIPDDFDAPMDAGWEALEP